MKSLLIDAGFDIVTPHPYDIERYLDEAKVVGMHENRWIPAVTLIIGLPDGRENDVIKTIELVERLSNYSYSFL